MIRRKKKVIKNYWLINDSQPTNFLNKLKIRVDEFQDNGYEVDVQYSLDGSFSALIIVYEVK